MNRDLAGRVALVTGGGRGFGKAISGGLARRGADVVIVYMRNRAAAEETCQALELQGVRATGLKANVGNPQQIERMVETIRKEFGRLDVIVSNAASGVDRTALGIDQRAWDWTMNINARSLPLIVRAGLDLMRPGSSVVALSSLGAERATRGYAIVGVSKAALEAMVRHLAVALGPKGIRVNAVSPGPADTTAIWTFASGEEMMEWQRMSPAGRLVTPEAVADSIDFLTSARSAMVTGQTLVVDGGAMLSLMGIGVRRALLQESRQ